MTTRTTKPRTTATGEKPDDQFPVPPNDAFGPEGAEADFLAAPELTDLLSALVEKFPRFEHLTTYGCTVLWRREAGSSKGMTVLGQTTRPSGLLAYYCEDTAWVITLAADVLRDRQFTYWEVEALLFHEINHTYINPKGKPALIGHEIEMFVAELDEYGAWSHGLMRVADAVKMAEE